MCVLCVAVIRTLWTQSFKREWFLGNFQKQPLQHQSDTSQNTLFSRCFFWVKRGAQWLCTWRAPCEAACGPPHQLLAKALSRPTGLKPKFTSLRLWNAHGNLSRKVGTLQMQKERVEEAWRTFRSRWNTYQHTGGSVGSVSAAPVCTDIVNHWCSHPAHSLSNNHNNHTDLALRGTNKSKTYLARQYG